MKIIDRIVDAAVERVILRLYRTGSIDVTVRHVAPPQTVCAACKGTGRSDARLFKIKAEGELAAVAPLLAQGICMACRGRG